MRKITFSQATLEAMAEEMRRDPGVFLLGEDLARQGGVFGQFKGLPQEFGFERVLDTPISEAAIVGVALGAALTGMRPVVDIHFADFFTAAMDEVVNQIAKLHYMFGGQASAPLVIRAPDGIVPSAGAQHTQSLEAWFAHVPGLKLVAPSCAADAKGLLKAAIRDPDPVLYFEHKRLFAVEGLVPDGEHLTPIGQAEVKRAGRQVTVIAYSIMVNRALAAAEQAAAEGLDVEVVDLRTLVPLDMACLADSIGKTHRVIVAHEAVRRGGYGAELAARIQEECFDDLDAPVMRLGAKNVPTPFSPPLDAYVTVQTADVLEAIRAITR